jgi:glycosidase
MGIYGFRLDVADELSDDFISNIKSRLTNEKESILYGEVWEDASNKIAYNTRKRYYLGTELDGVMNYPLRTGIIEYIKNKNVEPLAYALFEVMQNAPDRIMHAQMNLLGTHDTERILTVFGGEDPTDKSNDYLLTKRMNTEEYNLAVRRLCAAYTVLATLPGAPTIFYGDEAGLEGYHDPFNRMPYPWGSECATLLTHYRKVGKIRRSNAVYQRGGIKIYELNKDLLVFSRQGKECRYFTVMNNSEKPIKISFGSAKTTAILGSLTLAPISAGIYRVRDAMEIEISEAEQL